MMSSALFSKRSLFPLVLSAACVMTLSSCGYVDTLRNSMPNGYTYNSTKPISEPKKTLPYDSKRMLDQAEVDGALSFHKDKVDQLLEQMTPSLRSIMAGESVFLVSEQKNKDFDDALRIALRNSGLELDLTSMARYQMIYTIRAAKKDDFIGMSIQPTSKEIKTYDFYALNLVDTLHGQSIGEAYLIPGYHGFKVPQDYTPAMDMPAVEADMDHSMMRAQPVMDDSPMLAAPEEVIHEDISAPVSSYSSAYPSDSVSDAAPLAITNEIAQ